MRLIDDFYKVERESGGDTNFEYVLSLNKDHFIYKAHFPENPITPGVCIIQFCKELLEYRLEKSLSLKKIVNVKFLSIINPLVCNVIRVAFSKLTVAENGYKVSVSVCDDTTDFAKLSLCFKQETTAPVLDEEMRKQGICVIIPTYNNAPFLTDVIEDVCRYTSSVIVVNDGSTDNTDEILSRFRPQIEIVSYARNRGKGYALNRGFEKARSMGFSAAITMDSDGQHLASDLKLFVEAAKQHKGTMIIGSRQLEQENMPKKNTFANKFSNFWFALQTGTILPDTQTGFRLYPLARMKEMKAFTSRYEAELELLVRSAWRNIPLLPIPIQVYYPPVEERVSHFRPSVDFLRISVLNAIFVFCAILYGYPSKLVRFIFMKR